MFGLGVQVRWSYSVWLCRFVFRVVRLLISHLLACVVCFISVLLLASLCFSVFGLGVRYSVWLCRFVFCCFAVSRLLYFALLVFGLSKDRDTFAGLPGLALVASLCLVIGDPIFITKKLTSVSHP